VRLEEPLGLATHLLGEDSGWDRAAIEGKIATREWDRLDLARPMPIYFLYMTADTEGGEVVYAPDLYGYDDSLSTALSSVNYPYDRPGQFTLRQRITP
jgi:murein L,D-transpeptidase YcbB/YkuD